MASTPATFLRLLKGQHFVLLRYKIKVRPLIFWHLRPPCLPETPCSHGAADCRLSPAPSLPAPLSRTPSQASVWPASQSSPPSTLRGGGVGRGDLRSFGLITASDAWADGSPPPGWSIRQDRPLTPSSNPHRAPAAQHTWALMHSSPTTQAPSPGAHGCPLCAASQYHQPWELSDSAWPFLRSDFLSTSPH